MNGIYQAFFDEEVADRIVARNKWRHRSQLCLTPSGYALIKDIRTYKGDIYMAVIYKDNEGNVQEVVDSRVVTLDEIDKRLAEAQAHVSELQELRSNFVELTTGPSNGSADGGNTTTPPAAGNSASSQEDQGADAASGTTPPASDTTTGNDAGAPAAGSTATPSAPAADGTTTPPADPAAANGAAPANPPQPTPAFPA